MEGLMMGTRSGSIDPGILLYMLRTRRAVWRELETVLDHQSGLVGVFGRAAGMREIEKAAGEGNARARVAIDMFVSRAAAGIAAVATALPRLDGLVFTGGIGEHSSELRRIVCERFAFLGAALDQELNSAAAGDVDISSRDARTRVLVIEAREDWEIAKEVHRFITR